jgi:hypothetical protein
LQAGDPLVLRREPDNEIGADAILVLNEHTEMLGYVPRMISRWLAPVMDAGYRPEATVFKVREGCPYYERLVMEVRVVRRED